MALSPVEFIIQKRQGLAHHPDDLKDFIMGYVNGTVSHEQVSAWLMAVCIQGLSKKETADYTRILLESGAKVVHASDNGRRYVDKHSTGGIGDKTSILLVPIMVAAGVSVPMMSGRGLGHTGGTLDKLESIPGFRTQLTLNQFKNQVSSFGAAMIGQTRELVPADRLLYALRDVTGTIESIPLITGSIMSKKIAEGLDGLVLDVKTGTGAFMQTAQDSKTLALSMMETATSFGLKSIAFITNMNEPLGRNIGNWLEIKECLDVLQGDCPPLLVDLTLELAGAMLFLGSKADSIEEGIQIAADILQSGKAMDAFVTLVKLQGGDTTVIKDPSKYPDPIEKEILRADRDGYFNLIDNRQLGLAALHLGAGRYQQKDTVDPVSGIIMHCQTGQKIAMGDPILTWQTGKSGKIEAAMPYLMSSFTIEDSSVDTGPLILERLNSN